MASLVADLFAKGAHQVLASGSEQMAESGSEERSGLARSAEDPLVLMGFRLPESLKARVQHAAIDERVSLQDWLVDAIRRKLGDVKS